VTLHYRGKYIQEAIIRDLSRNKYVRGEGREEGREGGEGREESESAEN